MNTVIEAINKHKIIAIVRGVSNDKMLPMAQALYNGGIRLIEVTFNQSLPNCLEVTGEAIAQIRGRFTDMFVGAGTVLTNEQVKAAKAAGAQYIISPNTDFDIIRLTREMGMLSIPGAFTPSEIVAAHKNGANFVKLFPAGELGVGYLKAIRAPISHIPMLVVGGVDAQNMQSFLNAGATGFGIGGNIVDTKLIDAGEYQKLTQLALTYTSQIQ